MIELGPMPYEAVCRMLDDAYPNGALNYWKSRFLTELSDGAIDTFVERFARCPSPMTAAIFEHFHGEVTRIPVDATAVPHRQGGFNFAITGIWIDPETTDANVAWVRDTYDAMAPYAADRRWLNYLPADDGDEATLHATFGPNYDRLVELKSTYDPDNVFHVNANIKPRKASEGQA